MSADEDPPPLPSEWSPSSKRKSTESAPIGVMLSFERNADVSNIGRAVASMLERRGFRVYT